MPRPKTGKVLAADVLKPRGLRLTEADWNEILDIADILDVSATEVVVAAMQVYREHLVSVRPGFAAALEAKRQLRAAQATMQAGRQESSQA